MASCLALHMALLLISGVLVPAVLTGDLEGAGLLLLLTVPSLENIECVRRQDKAWTTAPETPPSLRVPRSPVPPCGTSPLNCRRVKVPWRAPATARNLQPRARRSPPLPQDQRTTPLLQDRSGPAPLRPS
nr:protein SNORC isoform X2 [Peromyscus maniculatus bairdii]